MQFQEGAIGQFDVLADGEVIASRSRGFWSQLFTITGWPDEDEVVRAIASRR